MLHLMQSEDTIDDWTLKGLSEKRVQARDSYIMWRIENNADFSFDIKLDLKRKIEKETKAIYENGGRCRRPICSYNIYLHSYWFWYVFSTKKKVCMYMRTPKCRCDSHYRIQDKRYWYSVLKGEIYSISLRENVSYIKAKASIPWKSLLPAGCRFVF